MRGLCAQQARCLMHLSAQEEEPEAGPSSSSESEEEEAPSGAVRRGLRGSVSLSSSSDSGAYARSTAFAHVPKLKCVRDNSADDDEEEEDAAVSSGDEGVIAQFIAGEEENVQLVDQTRRLAVVDLEWERIRAVDIYAVRVTVCMLVCVPARLSCLPGAALLSPSWRLHRACHGVPLRLWAGAHEGRGGAWPAAGLPRRQLRRGRVRL